MAGAAQVQLVGMKELRTGLRKASSDNEWRVGLRGVYATVAGFVEMEAQGKASATRMGSAAVASIKGKGTTTGATLRAFKGATGKYGPGFEYGSNGAFPQFGPRTPGGKSLYPAIGENRDRIEELMMDGVDRLLANTFPD